MSNIMFFIIMIALFLIMAMISGHGDSEHVQLDAKLNDLVSLDGSLLPFCWRLSANTHLSFVSIDMKRKTQMSKVEANEK